MYLFSAHVQINNPGNESFDDFILVLYPFIYPMVEKLLESTCLEPVSCLSVRLSLLSVLLLDPGRAIVEQVEA